MNLWQPTGLSVARVWVLTSLIMLKLFWTMFLLPPFWRAVLVGFKFQREDVELAGVEVGEVGVGIDVILPVNRGLHLLCSIV